MKKLIDTLITISTVAMFQACGNEEGRNSEFNSTVVPAVEAVQAQFGSLPLEERLNGIVSACNQVDIYARISAPIKEIYVQYGDIVSRGDALPQTTQG